MLHLVSDIRTNSGRSTIDDVLPLVSRLYQTSHIITDFSYHYPQHTRKENSDLNNCTYVSFRPSQTGRYIAGRDYTIDTATYNPDTGTSPPPFPRTLIATKCNASSVALCTGGAESHIRLDISPPEGHKRLVALPSPLQHSSMNSGYEYVVRIWFQCITYSNRGKKKNGPQLV